MQNFTTNAINLKSYNLSENDKIVVMYSKEKGIIRGVAKGVKKIKSKLGGRMDMLIANRLLMRQGRNLDTICQAESINTFRDTRNNLDKLFYSIYCSDVVNSFGIENDPNSEEIYELFYKTLEAISKSVKKTELLIALIKFQLKITHIAGYSLELETCACCGGKLIDDEIYFSPQNGGTICGQCKKHSLKSVKLHFKIRDFLNTLLQMDFNAKTRYDELATDKICEFCFELLKSHVEQFAPKKIKSASNLEALKST